MSLSVQWQRKRRNCIYFREDFSDLEWNKAYDLYLKISLEWDYSRLVLFNEPNGLNDWVVLEEIEKHQ